MNLKLHVHDRHRVGIGPHLGGAHLMVLGSRVVFRKTFEELVSGVPASALTLLAVLWCGHHAVFFSENLNLKQIGK